VLSLLERTRTVSSKVEKLCVLPGLLTLLPAAISSSGATVDFPPPSFSRSLSLSLSLPSFDSWVVVIFRWVLKYGEKDPVQEVKRSGREVKDEEEEDKNE
jgi:hypothetical protein